MKRKSKDIICASPWLPNLYVGQNPCQLRGHVGCRPEQPERPTFGERPEKNPHLACLVQLPGDPASPPIWACRRSLLEVWNPSQRFALTVTAVHTSRSSHEKLNWPSAAQGGLLPSRPSNQRARVKCWLSVRVVEPPILGIAVRSYLTPGGGGKCRQLKTASFLPCVCNMSQRFRSCVAGRIALRMEPATSREPIYSTSMSAPLAVCAFIVR